eukprot:TRINITY_DN37141_c0_g1_i1.p2 TRINITY_DN37141_c0_g1~~TRINITY_DN37141_c0_g1_i1.p2  ORF type:complete len:145 (-),score=12.14 TRINITY_DN37141_c0_g1_i1:20-454(-)
MRQNIPYQGNAPRPVADKQSCGMGAFGVQGMIQRKADQTIAQGNIVRSCPETHIFVNGPTCRNMVDNHMMGIRAQDLQGIPIGGGRSTRSIPYPDTDMAKQHIMGNNAHPCAAQGNAGGRCCFCLLYTSPSPRDRQKSRMPSSA